MVFKEYSTYKQIFEELFMILKIFIKIPAQ